MSQSYSLVGSSDATLCCQYCSSLLCWVCFSSEMLNVSAVGRLVKDNDRSELLNQAEPVDYSSSIQALAPGSAVTSGLYQASNAAPQPLQQTGGDWAVMSGGPSRPSRRAPPRGIFDDI